MRWPSTDDEEWGGMDGGRGKLHDILTKEGKDCDMLRLSPRTHAPCTIHAHPMRNNESGSEKEHLRRGRMMEVKEPPSLSPSALL